MPDFSFNVYALPFAWDSPNSFTYGTGTQVDTLIVNDNDNIYNDTNNGETIQNDVFGLPTTGLTTTSEAQTTVTGSDGSTITLYIIRALPELPIGSSPGYYVSDAPLVPGVTYTYQSSNLAGDIAYAALAVCFTRGTLIKTQAGDITVEELSAGDMVLTMDHGYQPIRWLGSTERSATGSLAPILIRKGALGNDRDLRVSPQHRMLLQGWQAELLFGEAEVLATAKSLVNDNSIIRVEGGEVEYFHILFDTHEIIYAEGTPSESFHPGEQGWKALDEPTRNEIVELFPELSDGDFSSYGPAARVSLKHKEGQLLGQYMLQVNEGYPYA